MHRVFGLFVPFFLAVHLSCAGTPTPHDPQTGGASALGGASGATAGGAAPGGASQGGASTGGSPSGGAQATGGAGVAGTPAGGVSSGGAGASSGGASSGAGGAGASSGGASSGAGGAGASSGGASSGAGGSGGAGGAGSSAGGSAGTTAAGWVGTWATAPQLTETANNPPSPGLTNNTLRQIVYVSIGGSRLRVRFSNQYGNAPVTMSAVHIAASTSAHSITAATDRALAFSGMASVTIPTGMTVMSDPVDFALAQQSKVAITIAFGSTPSNVTGHPGSRTTSYIATGNAVAAASLTSPASTEHWYYVTGIDVEAPSTSRAVVTLGDSITDGRGSTTDMNNRWPDNLSRRLRANAGTAGVGVLNQGIGGNAVVTGGLGPTAVSRFQRDCLDQASVRWVIVLHGVNDIGGGATAQSLITAYQGFVTAARARSVRIYGVPVLPFGGSDYDSAAHEMVRQTVNTWIRGAGNYDAVIDLDAAVRDPAAPTRLLATYDSGDMLHLSPAGYQRMADAIDLALFAQ